MLNKYLAGVLVVMALLINACAINKYLQDDQLLYSGTEVELRDTGQFVYQKELKNQLLGIAEPDPNSKFRLWVYYAAGDTAKQKGILHFVRTKIGQEPVFYKEEDVERTKLRMRKYLRDLGYFGSQVTYDTVVDKHSVTAIYNIQAEGRHKIRKVILPNDSLDVTRIAYVYAHESPLEAGEYYDVSTLKSEREFLATEIRNVGYFDFDENDIFFFVDTNAVHTPDSLASDVWLKIRKPSYDGNFKRYFIGQTHVFPNYNLNLSSSLGHLDSIHRNDIHIYHERQIIKPRTLDESIAQDRGEPFSQERQVATNNHLLDLGIYKFVNVKYKIREEFDTNFLDRYIYLTPGEVQDLSAEVEASTRAAAYGMSVKGTYAHKNIFRGAERLDLSLSTGFERGGKTFVGDDTISNNVVDVTGRATLTFPRFIVPFVNIDQSSTFHIPRTRIGFVANYQRRKELFTSTSYRVVYGYDWAETRHKRHQFDLFSFEIVNISDRTPAFEELLLENPRLRRSLTNMVILGSTYTYTLTNQEIGSSDDYFFFLGQFEAAGNTTYLASKLFSKKDEGPYELFGREFSQYTKFDVDYRYHWLGRRSGFVTRFSGGIGIPYLNSSSLPYIKQYFVGGTNSMRAFPVRGLLGSYREDQGSDVAVSSFEQTGEMKLEANLEYRFDLLPQFYLKGAFFLDVGNTWLLDPQDLEEDRSKVFATNRFLSELAVGFGTGVRIDIQYIVLRLDLAVPLKKPYLDPGDRWTFEHMGTDRWLNKNLTFNIALGYPF